MFGKGGHSKQSICHKMSEITGQKRGEIRRTQKTSEEDTRVADGD